MTRTKPGAGCFPVPASSGRRKANNGEWSELSFDLYVGQGLGLSVWKPVAPAESYDRLVVIDGRFLRVQIKTVGQNGRMYVRSLKGHGKPAESYTPNAFDFMVGVDSHRSRFFVFPMSVIQGLSVQSINVNREQFQPYEDSWSAFMDMAPANNMEQN